MRINVSIDNTRLLSRLKNAEKRIAYGVVNALNNTAKKIQEAERARVLRDFTVRKRDFVLRQAAVIKPFASVGKNVPYVEISVGQKSRLLLSQYETGGERKPFKGKRVAVPIIGNQARPSFTQSVPTDLQIGRLRFARTRPQGPVPEHGRRKRTKKSSTTAVRYGQKDTYMIPSVGVFKRTGKKSSELLYAFVSNEQLPAKLNFVETADATTQTWFHEFLEREIADSLARHGGA